MYLFKYSTILMGKSQPRPLLVETSSSNLFWLLFGSPHSRLCQLNWHSFFYHRFDLLCPHSLPSLNEYDQYLYRKMFYYKSEKASSVQVILKTINVLIYRLLWKYMINFDFSSNSGCDPSPSLVVLLLFLLHIDFEESPFSADAFVESRKVVSENRFILCA